HPDPGPAPRPIGPRLVRGAVSVWIVIHRTAIVVAPASVSPSSEIARASWLVFRPYLEALYLNHGYHFFAPEPGESTLLAFVAERPDGTVVQGRIPSRSMKPRLLYHRHFMLTEHMRDALRDAPEQQQQDWIRSYAEHLCRKY